MTDLFHLEHFQPREGEPFDLLLDDGSRYPLILQAAALTPRAFPEKTRDPFELLFVGTADTLRQRIWPMDNAAMGRLELFLVPIRRENGKAVYQAIFT